MGATPLRLWTVRWSVDNIGPSNFWVVVEGYEILGRSGSSPPAPGNGFEPDLDYVAGSFPGFREWEPSLESTFFVSPWTPLIHASCTIPALSPLHHFIVLSLVTPTLAPSGFEENSASIPKSVAVLMYPIAFVLVLC